MEVQIYRTVRDWHLTERVWFNALWFQTTWFICVIGRGPWVPVGLVMITLHFLLCEAPLMEARRLAPLALVGIGADALLSICGVFDFGPGVILPAWLAVLWVAFSTTLTRSLAIFGRHAVLAAVIGGVGVPFNYAVGARLDAVTFSYSPMTTGVVLVALWAMLLPLLYRLARRNPHTG